MTFDTITQIAAEIAVLLLAVSFHESAHGLVALLCGDTTARDLGRITLNPVKHLDPLGSVVLPLMLALSGAPVFGWAKPVPVSLRGVPNPRRANLMISAAGPASNLILAALFAALFVVLRRGTPPPAAGSLWSWVLTIALLAVFVNVTLAVFNLLPIPPLDGFGVLESLLPPRLLPLAITLRRYGPVLFLIAIFSGLLRGVLVPARRLVIELLLGGSL